MNHLFLGKRSPALNIEWYPIHTQGQAGRKFVFTTQHAVEWTGKFIPNEYNVEQYVNNTRIPASKNFTSYVEIIEHYIEGAYKSKFKDGAQQSSFIRDGGYFIRCGKSIPVRFYTEWGNDRSSCIEELNECLDTRYIILVLELTGIVRQSNSYHPTFKPHAVYWGKTSLPNKPLLDRMTNDILQVEMERRKLPSLEQYSSKRKVEEPSYDFEWMKNILHYIIPRSFRDMDVWSLDEEDGMGYKGSILQEKMDFIKDIYMEKQSITETISELKLQYETAESIFKSQYSTQPETPFDWQYMHTHGFVIELYRYAIEFFTHMEDYQALSNKNPTDEYWSWARLYKPKHVETEEDFRMDMEYQVRQYFLERILNRCVDLGASVRAHIEHNRFPENIFELSLDCFLTPKKRCL